MQAGDSADDTADPPRLQPQELKVLAEDIEAAGGIASIKLQELLDSKVEGIKGRLPIYGVVGSKRRRQISNKVDKWKKKESEKYLEILTKLGVEPFADRTRGTRARRTNQRPTAASQNTGADVEAAEAAIATLNISSQPSSNTNTMSTAKGPSSNTNTMSTAKGQQGKEPTMDVILACFFVCS
jgi:hypothetical protein